MDPLQLAGSLLAVLALAGLARWLGLGRSPLLASEEDARRAAQEAVDGFDPIRFGIDREGRAALLADAAGRILLLKQHGNFFAARLLGTSARAELAEAPAHKLLIVHSGERRFGSAQLELDDAGAWAEAINRLNGAGHA